jgi:hypothetical protein
MPDIASVEKSLLYPCTVRSLAALATHPPTHSSIRLHEVSLRGDTQRQQALYEVNIWMCHYGRGTPVWSLSPRRRGTGANASTKAGVRESRIRAPETRRRLSEAVNGAADRTHLPDDQRVPRLCYQQIFTYDVTLHVL